MSNVYGAGGPGVGGASWLSNLPLALQQQLTRVARYTNPASYATDPTASTIGPDAGMPPPPARANAMLAAQSAPPILPSVGGSWPMASGQGPGPTVGQPGLPPGLSSTMPGTAVGAGAQPSMGYPGGQGPVQVNDPKTGLPISPGGYPALQLPPNSAVGWGNPAQGGGPIWTDSGFGGAAPTANPVPVRTRGGGARIPATATANVPPAVAAPSRFGGIDRQNLSATGWNPGTRMGTALDLSGLFGQRSDMVAPPSAQPVSGGALSKGGTKGLLGRSISPTTGKPMPMSTADIAYGLPDTRGAPYPYAYGSPRRAAAIAAAAKRSGFA
jgi:hypothetical protein